MSHHVEQKAERIATELSRGQVQDAARELRCELDRNPREALALIQMANQMRDHRSPDHIVVQNGNVFVRDEYHRTQTYAGHLDNRNHGRQDDCDPRYSQGRYDQGRYNNGYDPRNDGRYDPRNDGRYDPRNNQPYEVYGNPYPNQRDCPPPVYRQPDVYPQERIYIPDCYGNQERQGINPGTAALLVLGGVVLGRTLGHGGGHYQSRDHRR